MIITQLARAIKFAPPGLLECMASSIKRQKYLSQTSIYIVHIHHKQGRQPKRGTFSPKGIKCVKCL